MNRRDFLIQTGIVSLGTGLICPEVFAQQSMHANPTQLPIVRSYFLEKAIFKSGLKQMYRI